MDGEEQVFCGGCGARIRASVKFCTRCGVSQEQFAEPHETVGSSEPTAVTELLPVQEGEADAERGLAVTEELGVGSPEPDRAADETEILEPELDDEPEITEPEITEPEIDEPEPAVSEPEPEPEIEIDGSGSTLAEFCTSCGHRFDADARFCKLCGAAREDLSALAAAGSAEIASKEPEPDGRATESELPERPSERSRLFSVGGTKVWATTRYEEPIDGLQVEHVEVEAGKVHCPSMGFAASPAGGDSSTQRERMQHGTPAPSTLRDDERVLITMVGDSIAIDLADGEGIAFGVGACMITDRRLVALLSGRPTDDSMRAIDLKGRMAEIGITAVDSAGNALDPVDVLSEYDKHEFFLDGAGWLDDRGDGVALAVSIDEGLFDRGTIQGGKITFRLGSPVVKLAGEQLEFGMQLLWVVDENGWIVNPKQEAVQAAMDQLARARLPLCTTCEFPLEADSRFCTHCGAPTAGASG